MWAENISQLQDIQGTAEYFFPLLPQLQDFLKSQENALFEEYPSNMNTRWSWSLRTPVNRFYSITCSFAKPWYTILETLGISCRMWANSLYLPKSWGKEAEQSRVPILEHDVCPSPQLTPWSLWSLEATTFLLRMMEDTRRHYLLHRTTGQKQHWDLWEQSVPQQPLGTKNEQFHQSNNAHVTTKGRKPLYCARSDWQPTNGKWALSSL